MGSDVYTIADSVLKDLNNSREIVSEFMILGFIMEYTNSKEIGRNIYNMIKKDGYIESDQIGYRISKSGINFIDFGGYQSYYKEREFKEISIRAAEATIKVAGTQKKVTYLTLAVAIITCIALVVQIVMSICKS